MYLQVHRPSIGGSVVGKRALHNGDVGAIVHKYRATCINHLSVSMGGTHHKYICPSYHQEA